MKLCTDARRSQQCLSNAPLEPQSRLKLKPWARCTRLQPKPFSIPIHPIRRQHPTDVLGLAQESALPVSLLASLQFLPQHPDWNQEHQASWGSVSARTALRAQPTACCLLCSPGLLAGCTHEAIWSHGRRPLSDRLDRSGELSSDLSSEQACKTCTFPFWVFLDERGCA